MKFLYRTSLVVVVLFGMQLPACAEKLDNSNYQFTNLDKFWTVFKKAALTGDKATMAKLSQFPIKLHGIMDYDPIIKMDEKSFYKNIDTILAQDPGEISTGVPDTTLDLFRRTKKLKDDGGGSARVGNLVFHTVNGRWLLVYAFLDGEDYK